jgi:hypothetical protein
MESHNRRAFLKTTGIGLAAGAVTSQLLAKELPYATSLFAQIPERMSFQAVIRNSSNQLVTSQEVGMKISILQGSASGSPVYIETNTPTTNANGLATIEIGGGSVVSGAFSTIDWANGPYFIKTETDPSGGTNYIITGTSQLLSVPYALHAKTAENAFSGDYEDLTNKPTLFQSALTDATLTGDGTSSSPLKIAQQSATSGQVLKWNGTTWSPDTDSIGNPLWSENGSNIFYNKGNVGIGTQQPGESLTINGNAEINGNIIPNGKVVTNGNITIESKNSNVVVLAGANKITIDPSGGVTVESNSITLAATGNLTLSAPTINIAADNILKLASQQLNIEGTYTSMKGQAELKLEGTETNIEATQLKMVGGAQAELNGAMIKVEGSGITEVTGAIVKIN